MCQVLGWALGPHREQDTHGPCVHGVYLVTETGSQINLSARGLTIIQRSRASDVPESQLVWGPQRALLRR